MQDGLAWKNPISHSIHFMTRAPLLGSGSDSLEET
jgi:hypothetical protein